VVYAADQDTNDINELYSVPVTGPASQGVKLNGALANGGNVGFSTTYYMPFLISPNSSRVVYYADQESDGMYELYSVPINGSTSGTKINVTLAPGSYVYPGSYSISPDSQKVTYSITSNSQAFDLYSVPISGPTSNNIKLDDEALLGSDEPKGSRITPDNRVLIYAYPNSAPGLEVYSVPLQGPASAAIILAAAQNFAYAAFGSGRLVYNNNNMLYSVPLSGPDTASIPLIDAANSDCNTPNGGYYASLSPDESRVVFLSGPNLCSVPIAGPATASVKISGPMVTGGGVQYYSGWGFSPDGNRVVYRADAEVDNQVELYVTDEGYLLTNKVYLPLIRR
jgi:hypothetical protein